MHPLRVVRLTLATGLVVVLISAGAACGSSSDGAKAPPPDCEASASCQTKPPPPPPPCIGPDCGRPDAGSDADAEAGRAPDLLVAAGYSCFLSSSQLFCAGTNEYGQLGNGTADGPDAGNYPSHSPPVASAGALRFDSISGRNETSCGLTSDGRAFCWGNADTAELPSANAVCRSTWPCQTTPLEMAPATRFRAITAGGLMTCGLTTAGAASCWGIAYGQGGSTPLVSPGPYKAVSAGDAYGFSVSVCGTNDDPKTKTHDSGKAQSRICALDASGQASCWNHYDNDVAMAEGGTTCGAFVGSPVPVPASGTYETISTGALGACALDKSGAGFCWGMNRYGSRGDGTTSDHGTPAPVLLPMGKTFASIVDDTDRACGVTTTGEVYCWGTNTYGALGQGTEDGLDHPTPLLVPNLPSVDRIAMSTYGTCALTKSGERWCWGWNLNDRFGDGTRDAHVLGAKKMP